MKRKLWSVLLLLGISVLFITSGVYAQDEMTAYFLDVSQGDASLLIGPDFTILIDTGDSGRDDVVPLLRSIGVEELDLVIITHPHADHIGQLIQVLETFEVHEVWMSGYEHTTRLFERTLDALLRSDAGYYEPRVGETIEIGSLQIEILNPDKLTKVMHETCICLRAVYGDISFVFTGDAERKTEEKIVTSGLAVNAQILQLGHHGSRTSSSITFLDAVNPKTAIYSAGVDNPFGHPHPEVVERLIRLGIKLYGTDVHGTIKVITDGTSYSVITEKGPKTDHSRVGRVNINTAGVEELQQIIHIGPERAEEIIRLRPFHSLNDLRRVRGIGPSRLRDIKEQGIAYVEE
jgi:competence protein ComEC